MRLPLTILLIAILLLGCSDEETQENKEHAEKLNQINQSASENPGNKISDSKESIKKIAFEIEQRFGSTDEVVVGKIATIAIDDQNRVFIADMDQTTVHVFSPDGDYLASLGRQGKGPGEYNAVSPYTAMKIHSNRIYIMDGFYQVRAHVYLLDDLSFSHTIKLVAGNRSDYELDGYYPFRIFPRNDGTFLVAYRRSQFDYKDTESFIRYVVQDSTGNIVSGSVLEQKDRTYSTYTYPTGGTHMTSFPFYGKSLLVVSGDRLYAANNTEAFKIDVYTPQGEHVRSFQHPFENKALTRSGLIDRYKNDEDLARLDRYEGDDVGLKMIRDAENLPETWPALESMFFDDENRLWVSTIVDDFDVYEWWLLKTTGEVITKFEWPRDKSIEAIRNSYLYTRETEEETGIQSIVRYRIEMN